METTHTPPNTDGMPRAMPAEQRAARALDNRLLAARIDSLRINRRAFTKAEADAFLAEAARRLRWPDAHAANIPAD